MGRALLSVVVGLAGAAALAGAGWTLQTVALPKPARADRVAADVSAWLRYHRLAIDIFYSDGHRFRGYCLRGWYPVPRHRGLVVRGSLLALQGGPVVLVTGRRRIRLLSGHGLTELPASLAAAAGCTKALATVVDGATQSNIHLQVRRAYAAGQPALELRVPRLRDERLTIDLSPRTYLPLVVHAVVGARVVTARLYLARVTRSRAASFRRIFRLLGLSRR